MSTDGDKSALFSFIACVAWYVSVVSLLALGQPMWALLVLLAGVLRPRRLPHVVAMILTWPHLNIGLAPRESKYLLDVSIGVVGIELHPVCIARRYLEGRHQASESTLVEVDLAAGPESIDTGSPELDAFLRGLMRDMESRESSEHGGDDGRQ